MSIKSQNSASLGDSLNALQPTTVDNVAYMQMLRMMEIPGYERAEVSRCGVAFSSDASLLDEACEQNPVPLWEVQTGLLHLLQYHVVFREVILSKSSPKSQFLFGYTSYGLFCA